MSRDQSAFSLIELLTALSVLSLLTVCAIPSLTTLYQENRLTTRIQAFTDSLLLTRSEAVKRHQRVLMCPSTDQTRCVAGGTWPFAWMVFVDQNEDGGFTAGETIIRAFEEQDKHVSLTSSRTTPIAFYSHGRSAGSNATFIFCDSRGSAAARAVILNNSGRFRISRTESDGGKFACSE